MSHEVNYRELRNQTILLLHNHSKIRNMEIAKLEVQHLDKSLTLVRIQRGDRVFRVSLSPQITENMKLLIKDKEFNDYIFVSSKSKNKHISHTMIKKIIDNVELRDTSLIEIKKESERYTVVYRDYKYRVFKSGEPTGLELNNIYNAYNIANALNADINGDVSERHIDLK